MFETGVGYCENDISFLIFECNEMIRLITESNLIHKSIYDEYFPYIHLFAKRKRAFKIRIQSIQSTRRSIISVRERSLRYVKGKPHLSHKQMRILNETLTTIVK